MVISRTVLTAAICFAPLASLSAETFWIEGENPADSDVVKHPWYHQQVKSDELSGKAFISHFSEEKPGSATYEFEVKEAGEFDLWLRANPVGSRISFQLNDDPQRAIDMDRSQTGNVNLASDGAPDLRFVAWAHAGKVKLVKGKQRIVFRFSSENQNHGSLDCFVLTREPFTPMGVLKPHEVAAHLQLVAEANVGWSPWPASADPFGESLIDLRGLNESFAGEKGGIARRGDHFIYRNTGEIVRFWGVNGPPHELSGDDLAYCARMLAKRGVNLTRLHGGVFDEKTGAYQDAKATQLREAVAAMKTQGIYSHLSIYFPLWMKPEPGKGWREGYDGNQHPFALLFFEPEFQKLYRDWWKSLLTTPRADGSRLLDDPAVMGLELINEDSFFFWTFSESNVPDPQLRKLEKQFGDWAIRRHGSIEKALSTWENLQHPRDSNEDGRLGFRPLDQMFTHKTPRDQATAEFLLATQKSFYQETTAYLRELGFKGLITASNWTTANNDIFGPLEKYSYTDGDFIDRHGYFGSNHQGDQAGWSVREGHTFSNVSALKFEAESPGKPRSLSHPAVDPTYNEMPSMISETTWNRPNRHRGEAPLYYAAYGALQGTDAVVHFALDSKDWSVKPGYFMQPWTLMSPTQMGQFPAAAFIFRKGLIQTSAPLVNVSLPLADAIALKGTPLAQQANLDELRKADVDPHNAAPATSGAIDPLVHFAGRTDVHISREPKPAKLTDLHRFIDRKRETVTSATGELRLDYAKGLLTLNAPAAQGAIGNLEAGGKIIISDLIITCPLDAAQIIAVALDDQPIAKSSRILLQVMSEEKPTDFATETLSPNHFRITALGNDPWLFREIQGTVQFTREDAASLRVTRLDVNGQSVGDAGTAKQIQLHPNTIYYLIHR